MGAALALMHGSVIFEDSFSDTLPALQLQYRSSWAPCSLCLACPFALCKAKASLSQCPRTRTLRGRYGGDQIWQTRASSNIYMCTIPAHRRLRQRASKFAGQLPFILQARQHISADASMHLTDSM